MSKDSINHRTNAVTADTLSGMAWWMQATEACSELKLIKEINYAPTPCVGKLIITLTVEEQ